MAGPHVVHIANMIEECEGMAKIEELQNHENIEIYKLAYDIIEQFFSDEVRNFVCTFRLKIVTFFYSTFYQVDESNIVPVAGESGYQFNQTPNIPTDGFKF